MRELTQLGESRQIFGLIHLPASPGTPHFTEDNLNLALEKALADAWALYRGGAQGGLIQTIDGVYSVGEAVDPARLAFVAGITNHVAMELPDSFQVGVQVMWNAQKASLGVAYSCGGSYIRCSSYVGSTHSPYGVAEANPADFLQYQRLLGAQRIRIVAEIHSMHYQSREGLSLGRLAEYAWRCGAHAVEIAEPEPATVRSMIADIKNSVPDLPVMLGGHTNHGNVGEMLADADGAFVGTCFQPDGWGTNIHEDQVQAYMDEVRKLG